MRNFWNNNGGGIVGGSLGILGSLISGAYQRRTAEEQTRLSAELGLKNAKEMAGLNYQYNEQAAENAMGRSKELAEYNQALGLDTTQKLWERYNSPEAKVKALKEAGLGVGLMYSGAGGGGTIGQSQAGANGPQGGGASGPSAGGVGAALGVKLELGQMMADIAYKNALTRKTNEEAKTEAGDNDRGKAEIFKVSQEGLNAQAQTKLNNANATIAEIQSNIDGQKWEALSQNKKMYIDSIKAGFQTIIDNNEINNKTKQQQIAKVIAELGLLEAQEKIAKWESDNPKETALVKAGGVYAVVTALKDWLEEKAVKKWGEDSLIIRLLKK